MSGFLVLGGLTVTAEGREVAVGGSRQRRLLAVLLMHHGTIVSADRLIEVVFSSAPPPAAATTLRSYIARLRRVLDVSGGASIITRAPGYALHLDDDETLDAARFERLVHAASAMLDREGADRAAQACREALALWRGDPYAEFADEDWAHPEAQRLRELHFVAWERLVDAELACGRASEILARLEALVAESPLRESFRVQLVIALHRSGRQADALESVRVYRALLADELGLDPSPALAELEHQVLTHDPTLSRSADVGERIRGYRLDQRLGAGPRGVVHSAHADGDDRDLVIRALPVDVANAPWFVQSFEHAARRVSALRHPAVVPLLDHWRDPGGAYLVTPRLPGGSLADRLARGPLATSALRSLVERVGGALAMAHAAGAMHGGITAERVLFDHRGDPNLDGFDVGTARPAPRPADDVRAMANLVGKCLLDATPGIRTILDRAAMGGPPMDEFIRELLIALDGVPAEPRMDNPYKGLRPFDEADAADFFGRGALVDALVARLSRRRLVVVLGGSGSGKTSLVGAGLLPRVRAGIIHGSSQWFVTTMRPGPRPLRSLAEALRHVAVAEVHGLVRRIADDPSALDGAIRDLTPDGAQVLLVIDQFEELFTLADADERRALLDALVDALRAPDARLRVVATLRADFSDRALAVPRFAALMQDGAVLVPAMTAAELESAITGPAARASLAVEPPLVAEVVSAVVDRPAALPALQFTLQDLAERTADTLTLAAYRELGGVGGAIAARADGLFRALPDESRAVARALFERLVTLTPEGEPTRRRQTRAELADRDDGGEMDRAIDRWADARLLALDRDPHTRAPTVEIAHEALLSAWPRLRDWIREDRAILVSLGRLRDAAAEWEGFGRDPGALYRGARLELALESATAHPETLGVPERAYLDAAREARDRERAADAARAREGARTTRRLRLQLAVMVVALIGAFVGGFVAVAQRGGAENARIVATSLAFAAASDAVLADDAELATLLSLAAVDAPMDLGVPVPRAAQESLHRAVTASRVLQTVTGSGGALDWSPAGDSFATDGPGRSGILMLHDATSGAVTRGVQAHDGAIDEIEYSRDGSRLATAGIDGAVRVWDASSGTLALVRTVQNGSEAAASATGMSVSPDGSRIAFVRPDGVLRVTDVVTGDVALAVPAPVGPTSFSPDGAFVAVGGEHVESPSVTVFEIDTAARRFESGPIDDPILTDIAWSPDGRWIATAHGDATVRIWDAETGERLYTVSDHSDRVTCIDWAATGGVLVSASDDGTAMLTAITPNGIRHLQTYAARGTRAGLDGAAVSPDGTRVVTGDTAATSVRIWDAGTAGGEWTSIPSIRPSGSGERAVVFLADSRRLAVVDPSGRVVVTNTETGRHIGELDTRLPGRQDPGVVHLDVSTEGARVAAGSRLGLLALSDLGARGLFTADTTSHEGRDAVLSSIDLSDDGDYVAVAVTGDHDSVSVYDASGDVVLTLPAEPGGSFGNVSLSARARLVAAARVPAVGHDPSQMAVLIWDRASGDLVQEIRTPADRVAFDPSGDRIATITVTGADVTVWDVRSGARIVSLEADAAFEDLAFSSDGGSIVSGHRDGTIRLWDARNGVEHLAVGGGGGPVAQVALSPDGSKAASAGEDGVVKVWALDVDDLVVLARQRLTRGFTDDECRRYFDRPTCG
ncbi:nSTAND1 domain-containing NTPase [Agromyces binzhouensis]|uniref:nSTAND1 domain-containing NTPase n=1 Tax=Agromyces binzhouensis TaxID=1817495 RepID=UPI0036451235